MYRYKPLTQRRLAEILEDSSSANPKVRNSRLNNYGSNGRFEFCFYCGELTAINEICPCNRLAGKDRDMQIKRSVMGPDYHDVLDTRKHSESGVVVNTELSGGKYTNRTAQQSTNKDLNAGLTPKAILDRQKDELKKVIEEAQKTLEALEAASKKEIENTE